MRAATLEESDALHREVRAFAAGQSRVTFDELALQIARFQAEHIAGFRQLVARFGSRLDSVESIPGVPTDAFKLTRVAVHPPELDVVRFRTSGTSAEAQGVHALRSTLTYSALSERLGRRALMSEESAVVVALTPNPSDPVESSLVFMMREFMRSFDPDFVADGGVTEPPLERWLFGKEGANLAGLKRACSYAKEIQRPLLLLSTSLALWQLLEQLDGVHFPLPASSVVMHTGGPKRRSSVLDLGDLRARLALRFELDPCQIVAEYGMTELSSQLYEGTARGVSLKGQSGVFLPPAWLRVTPVDPLHLRPVVPGTVGLARFVDLGNVDSAVAVITQDLVRARDGGIELLGRQPGAVARGCSLAIEALLEGAE